VTHAVRRRAGIGDGRDQPAAKAMSTRPSGPKSALILVP
jgi:hypothetical protein